MEDFRLKVFCSVARNLSFTKASQELAISQPAISKHIQELEQTYGVKLFDRSAHRISLTHAGVVLFTHAEEILDHYRALNFDMHMLSQGHEGVLRLGADAIIAQYFIPGHLADFSTKFQDIKLSFIEGNTQAIEDAVEEQHIDLGLVDGHLRKPHLRYTPFMQDNLVLVASTSGRWAHLDSVTLRQMTELPLVLHDDNGSNLEVIEHALSLHEMTLTHLNIAMRLGSAEGVKRYTIQSDSVALISIHAALPEMKMGQLKTIDVEDVTFGRYFYFVRNLGQTNPLVRDFIDYIQQNINR